MELKKLSFILILLTGFLSGCTILEEKIRMEETKKAEKKMEESIWRRPTINHGEGDWMPCCMFIAIPGKPAKILFDRMPENMLITPPKGACLEGYIVKANGGTMCYVKEDALDNLEEYNCNVTIDYSTGATQNIGINERLNCEE
jgi:hypothetical protein